MEVYQVCIIVVAVIVVIMYIYKRFTGVDLLHRFAQTKPVITALAAAIDAVYKLWPNDVLKIAHTVLKAGAQGAQFAEDAWLMGQIEREQRNDYAKSLAKKMITHAGFEVTTQIEKIVEGIIEVTCILLPHGVEPKA